MFLFWSDWVVNADRLRFVFTLRAVRVLSFSKGTSPKSTSHALSPSYAKPRWNAHFINIMRSTKFCSRHKKSSCHLSYSYDSGFWSFINFNNPRANPSWSVSGIKTFCRSNSPNSLWYTKDTMMVQLLTIHKNVLYYLQKLLTLSQISINCKFSYLFLKKPSQKMQYV